MQVHDARELLDDLARVRRRARSDLQSLWMPLVLFGLLTVVGGVVRWALGGPALGAYWMVAGPAGFVATAWYYTARQRRLGIEGPAAPYVATGLAIMVGSAAAGWGGDVAGAATVSGMGPPLVVAAGYLVFAALERSAMLLALAVGLGGLALALLAAGVDPEPASVSLALCSGAAFVATGLWAALGAARR